MAEIHRRLRVWSLRVRALLRARRLQRDLDEELHFHVEQEIDAQISRGLSPADARRAALRRFGGLTQSREACRDTWGTEPLANASRDARYALRMMRRDRGFATVAILTLALAIGANVIVFSVVNAVLLRPLAFPNGDRIVTVLPKPDGRSSTTTNSSGPDFDDFHQAATSFVSLGATIPSFTMNVTGRGEPIVANCTAVSPQIFDVLGMKPLIGRPFRPEEYHNDGGKVILGEGFWRRQFGSDPHLSDLKIWINGDAAEVIGVMPAVPDVFDKTEIWMTYIPDFVWARQRDNKFLSLVGLLNPGISPTRAALEMTAIYHRMPGTQPTASVDVVPLQRRVTAPIASSLIVLAGAVLLVLLIACVNLTTLVLARGARRRREMAIRLGLGASRGRVVRQLLTETTMLTVAGGGIGVALAYIGIRLVARFNPGDLPRVANLRPDMSVLLLSLALAAIAIAVVGVVPALSFTRGDVYDALRSSRGETGADQRQWRAGLLASAEVAIALVLLTGAGLLVRSFWLLQHAPLGFQPDRVLTLFLRLADDHQAMTSWIPFYGQLLDRAEQQPAVTAAAVSDCLPTSHVASADLLPADQAVDPTRVPTADACFVSPHYFRALAIPLDRGRFFDTRDAAGAPPVVIVSASVARRFWPGQDPIGKRVAVNYRTLGRPVDETPTIRMVAGVVGDVRNRSLDSAGRMAVYLPYLQDPTGRSWRAMTLFVRTTGRPRDVVETVRADIRLLNHDVPIVRIATAEEVIGETLTRRRFTTEILSGFAAVALVLATIGLYGVMAQAVAQRTREIGIRLALGATGAGVVTMVLRQGMMLVVAGVVVGVGASWMLAHAVQDLMYGIGTSDPTTFVVAAALLTFVAALACLVPATRAVSVDPLVALRTD